MEALIFCVSRGGLSRSRRTLNSKRYPTRAWSHMVTKRTRPWLLCAAAAAQLIMPCHGSSLRGGRSPEVLGGSSGGLSASESAENWRGLIAGNLEQRSGMTGMSRRLQSNQACSWPSTGDIETVRGYCGWSCEPCRAACLGLVFVFCRSCVPLFDVRNFTELQFVSEHAK